LMHIASGLGVADRVTFAGYVSHDELPALLRVADIFVRPSIIEGFGNAFVEAFAAGIPVVATPVGGIPDFLTDGETGLFCAVHDPRSIVSVVQKYLGDHALTVRIVEKARKLAEQKYDWNIIAKDMRGKIFDTI
jgi:glycosyltransferase involved in cell wall biosynthesis